MARSKSAATSAVNHTTKVGWRPKEWARDVGLSRASVYLLIADNKIKSVSHGAARIITTPPSEYLASLPEA